MSLANEVNWALRQVGGVASDFPEELYNDSLTDGDACLFLFSFSPLACVTERIGSWGLGQVMGWDTKAKAYGVRFRISEQTKGILLRTFSEIKSCDSVSFSFLAFLTHCTIQRNSCCPLSIKVHDQPVRHPMHYDSK